MDAKWQVGSSPVALSPRCEWLKNPNGIRGGEEMVRNAAPVRLKKQDISILCDIRGVKNSQRCIHGEINVILQMQY